MDMLLVILMEKKFWTVLRKRIAKNELKSSMALKYRSSSNKTGKEITCAVMIRIIVSFANQIFLELS